MTVWNIREGKDWNTALFIAEKHAPFFFSIGTKWMFGFVALRPTPKTQSFKIEISLIRYNKKHILSRYFNFKPEENQVEF